MTMSNRNYKRKTGRQASPSHDLRARLCSRIDPDSKLTYVHSSVDPVPCNSDVWGGKG